MATIAELLNNKNLINDNKQNNSNKGNNFNKPKVKIKSDYGLSSSKKQSGGCVYNSSNQHKAQGTNNFNGNKQKPTAPYNFVRLNDKVIQPPLAEFILNNKDKKMGYKDFMASGEKYSGYFDVEIKNITPLYIGGADGAFSDGKNCCIPGSSLRGCLKNIFKIITNGNMKIGTSGDVDVIDRVLYYRSFASTYSKLKDEYDKNIINRIESIGNEFITVTKAKAGFLVRENKKYYVCPARMESVLMNDIEMRIDDKKVDWKDNKVELHTGAMKGKKHYYRFINGLWNIKFEIEDDVKNNYINDSNRKGLNLFDEDNAKNGKKDTLSILKGAEKYDYIVPCFFIEENGKVLHFGAGPLYRIPYTKSIGAHIPGELKKSSIDFADAVFGSKEAWGSRVFFEDLFLANGEKAKLLPKNTMKMLEVPKPTSFQNYLEADKRGLAQHWNEENANIRGYKLYWHKKAEWIATSEDKVTQNNKSIAPLKEGQHFYGRIRFENLDKTELGALAKLFEIGAEKNCCYKLGMGKPYGLGSVELKGKLYIKNKDCYTKLFDDNGFYNGYAETDLAEFTNTFDTYMQKQLGDSKVLYSKRMNDLKTLMSTANMADPKWSAKTQYIGIGKDAVKLTNKRIVLPSAEEVFKK